MKYELREVAELVELAEIGAIPSAHFVCDNDESNYLDGTAWHDEETLGFVRYATQEELDIINNLFVNL